MTLTETPGYEPHPAVSGAAAAPPLTLAGEHELLLRQVTIRAGDLLAAAAEGRWPTRELPALLGYLRAEVLRQAADEEWLLFPGHDAQPGFARLGRDHARLHAAADLLARAATGEGSFSPAQLATATRDLVTQLEHHLAAEEALLAAATAPEKVPATSVIGGRPHGWYPLTEGPVIDLDALPAGQATDAAVDRLLRLGRGERVELRSASDPSPVWRRMDALLPGRYGFAYLQDGPGMWRVQVTRRPEPSDAATARRKRPAAARTRPR
jgi:uncharacterized protein (DUF2249 family)